MIAENGTLIDNDLASRSDLVGYTPVARYAGDLPNEPEEQGSPFPLSAILNALRRTWKLSVPLAFALGIVGGLVGWTLVVPKYSASAQVLVQSYVPPLVFDTVDQMPGGRGSFELFLNTQRQLIVMPYVLNAALRNDDVALLVRSQHDPILWLQKELQVNLPGKGEIMEISLETESPTACVTIVNSVVDAYLEEVVLNERHNQMATLSERKDAKLATEREIRDKTSELKSLGEALGTSDPELLAVAREALYELENNLIATQSDLMRAEGRLRVGERVMSEWELESGLSDDLSGGVQDLPGDTALLPSIVRTPEIDRLEAEVASLSSMRAAILRDYGPSHPLSLQAEDRLRVQQQLLDRQIAYAKEVAARNHVEQRETSARGGTKVPFAREKPDIDSLELEVNVIRERESRLQQRLAEVNEEIARLEKSKVNSVEINLVNTDIDRLIRALDAIDSKIKHTEIELNNRPRIELINKAKKAVPPDPKKRIAVAGASGLGGFMAPLLLCIVWDLTRRKVDDAESVSSVLEVSTIGTIPRISGNPLKTSAGTSRRLQRRHEQLIDSVDSVAAMLMRRAGVENRQIFMVTSALAGEGKSTVACQLSESLARCGKRICLIDFDLRRPSIHRYRDLAEGPGISDILEGRVDLAATIQQGDPANLGVITAGFTSRRMHEQSSSPMLDCLFDELRDKFDIVIVDASPVLPVVDARIIGSYCDGVILTLIRDSSRVPAAARACEQLRAYGIEILGAVVIGEASSDYGASYGYRGDRS